METHLNAYGKELEKILRMKGKEIEDLYEFYPILEERVQLHLYESSFPSRVFSKEVTDRLHIKGQELAKLHSLLEKKPDDESDLRISA